MEDICSSALTEVVLPVWTVWRSPPRRSPASPVETPAKAIPSIAWPLPRRDLRVVNAVLGAQLRQRQVPLDRLERNLGLEISRISRPFHLRFRRAFRSKIS